MRIKEKLFAAPAFVLLLCLLTTRAPCASTASENSLLKGILNTTYTIENKKVHLVDGRAEQTIVPGAATKITTVVQGTPVYGDLNGDGRTDAALFLKHETGGSGTFLYVTAAIAANGGYSGTDAILLGDRIYPEIIHILNGEIVVEYKDRKPDQSMSTPPTVIKNSRFSLTGNKLTKIDE